MNAKEFLKKQNITDVIINKSDLPEYWKSISDLIEEYQALQLQQTGVSRGRCFGRTHEMVLEIKKALEERGECGVGLMKDATDTLKRLKDLGVNARAEPTYRTMPPMIKRNEFGEPIDLLLKEKVQIGMIFYLC